MRTKTIMATMISASLMLWSPAAYAGGRDVVVGVGVGLGLGLMLNELSKGGPRRPGDKLIGKVGEPPRGTRTRSREQIAAEQAERERAFQEASGIQNALNILNFDAGPVDGRPGRQTREAIRRFQASLSAPQTGTLTDQQKAQLMYLSQPQMAAGTIPPGAMPASPMPSGAMPMNGSSVAPGTPLAPASTLNTMPAAPGGTLPAQAYQTTLPTPATTLPTVQPTAIPTTTPALQPVTSDRSVAATMPTSLAMPQPAPVSGQEADVLGIKPGQTGEEAFAVLAEAAGAEACEKKPGSIVCKMEAGGMTDEIVLGKTTSPDDDRVHTIIRTMSFAEPVGRADIEAKLNASYPVIMANANRNVYSTLECEQTAQRLQDDNFRGLRQMIVAGEAIDARIAAFAAKCEYYHKIVLTGDDKLSQITIALFSGKPIMDSLGASGSGSASTSPATPDIRF